MRQSKTNWRTIVGMLGGLLLLATQASAANNSKIVIISSPNYKSHTDIVKNFRQYLLKTKLASDHIISIELSKYKDTIDQNNYQIELLIPIGTEACSMAMQSATAIPILCAAIPKLSFDELSAKYETQHTEKEQALTSALYLDQPIELRLNLLQEIMPHAKNVGIIYGPATLKYQKEIETICSQRGLSVLPGVVHKDTELVSTLDKVLKNSDVMLGIVDPLVFNRISARNILLTAYRWRVALIGISPSYVRAGALAAVYTTPEQIGMQLAEIVEQYIQLGKHELPKPAYPKYFDIAVNYQVAEFLGIHAENETILKQKIEHKWRTKQ